MVYYLAISKKGKGFVHFGGIPFRIPSNEIVGQWQEESEQTAYHMKMNIHQALPMKTNQVKLLKANAELALIKGFEELFTIENTYNFILLVTKVSKIENEMGFNGPMDARIYSLIVGITDEVREIAAPCV